ncbi:hypothetical protein BDR22DRAFT_877109 [Usnea florida]
MSFQLPPNDFTPAELAASKKAPVYVAVAVGFVLATGAVILRVLARRISKASFGWDDYTITFALLLLYALDISTVISAARYGLGRHLPVVISTVVPFQKVALANISLWLATAAATKASLLLLYYRLFSPSKRFRLAVRIGAVVVFCQWFSLTLVTIFQCRPVKAFWNHDVPGAKCINLPRFTIVSGVLNLLTDVLILCLPGPMVWSLNTTVAQKITLTGIFLLGIFVCVISIIRISKVAVVNYSDPTWRLVDVYLWTALENAVGIFSACLPTMRPLLGRFLPGISRSGSSNQKVGRPSSQRVAKAQFDRLFEESGPQVEPQGIQKGTHNDWTSPDLATSNELLTMGNNRSTPPYSVNTISPIEDRHSLNDSARRASYE